MTVEGSVQKSDRSGRHTRQDRLDQNRSPYSQFAWAGALEARLLPGKMGVDATEKRWAVMVSTPVMRRAKGASGSTQIPLVYSDDSGGVCAEI